MGEKIGSMGDIKLPQNQETTADEIARQLEDSKPIDMDEATKTLEAKDAQEGRQSVKLNKFGEIVPEGETGE